MNAQDLDGSVNVNYSWELRNILYQFQQFVSNKFKTRTTTD